MKPIQNPRPFACFTIFYFRTGLIINTSGKIILSSEQIFCGHLISPTRVMHKETALTITVIYPHPPRHPRVSAITPRVADICVTNCSFQLLPSSAEAERGSEKEIYTAHF